MDIIWTREKIDASIVRKEKHRPKFNLGREIYDEIFARVAGGGDVTVEEVAERLAEGYKALFSQHPGLYPEEYANILIMYHPGNGISSERLAGMNVEDIVDGPDFLLAARKDVLDEIGRVDLSIYVRDQSCPRDRGEFNSHVLVTQLRSSKQFYGCSKSHAGGEFKHCGAIGRTGYFLKLK